MRERDGVTLLELIVVMVIFGLLATALLISFLNGRRAYATSEASLQLQQETRLAMSRMVKDLHEAGHVNNDVSVAAPGAQRLDFQIVRDYDAALCGGICWGSDDPLRPDGWIHYALDASNPQNVRLMRCITMNRLDVLPATFAGCRMLASRVNAIVANTAFLYDQPTRTVTLRLLTSRASGQFSGGTVSVHPTPLVTQVKLRNAS